MKKKLLMISYSFPPIKGIGSIRNYNIAHQFQKYFDVKILSTKNKFKLPIEEIDVKRFSIKYLTTLDYKTVKGKSHLKEDRSAFQKKTKNNSFARKLTESFPFNLLFGEGGLFYILHGLLVSVRLNKKGHEIMYSSFRPMADHYIAYLSKKIHKNRLWIADFRDLPYYDAKEEVYVFPKFQTYLLNKIISKADYVITISEGLKTYFETYNNNVIVLRNGISKLSIQEAPNSLLDKFVITYTGSFYGNKRSPELLFKAIANLVEKGRINSDKLNLVYAGKDSEVWKKYADTYSLKTAIVTKGMITNEAAQLLQKKTHINVLISWATKNQKGILTGKFYEYLNAQRQVLVIINGEEDKEFEVIVNDLNIGQVFYNSEIIKIENFILNKYQEWETTQNVTTEINIEKLKSYTWDEQFSNFINKLNLS